MLAHHVRGRYLQHGSRSWTFPPAFHYILLPRDRWQQRGRLTEWHLTWKCVLNKEVELNSSTRKKKCTHWCLLILAEGSWKPSSGCEHSEAVGGAFQQQWQWVTSTGADIYKHGMLALVHSWQKCIANGGAYVEKECFVAENFLYQMVLLYSWYQLQFSLKWTGGPICKATYLIHRILKDKKKKCFWSI